MKALEKLVSVFEPVAINPQTIIILYLTYQAVVNPPTRITATSASSLPPAEVRDSHTINKTMW